ncbi:MAG: NAD(+) diphosphatase [Pseudomonadales bacterium]|nr:NAD(+) diphosphatase [Pseudomonadales bacterium]
MTIDWETLNIAQEFVSATASTDKFDKSFHILISDGEILTPDSAPWRPLTEDEYQELNYSEESNHFLGTVSGIPVFANEIDPDADEPEGYSFKNLWSFLGRLDDATFNLLGKSKQLVDWYQNHKFCGQCGKPTDDSNADRSLSCASCSNLFYPRLSPSIIVLVTRGEEILLAKNVNARGNFYSTLAGFIEPGESIEEAVHREVYEEVGIKIKQLEYFNSQSWPFPNSLMLGFHAVYDEGEIVLQAEEIADAQWFHYKDMPNQPAMVSISGWLVSSFIKKLENKL